jgi:FtsZ-binding cell division protein ZapB
MVSLEQIKLLESKVTKTIDYVKIVTEENKRLKEKLDSYQVRIDELEVLVLKFKEDQSLIEDGILSALDRLNQFEDAVGSLLLSESKPSTEQVTSRQEKKSAGPIIAPEPAAEPAGRGARGEPSVGVPPPVPAAEPIGRGAKGEPSVEVPPPEPHKEEKSSDAGELDIF